MQLIKSALLMKLQIILRSLIWILAQRWNFSVQIYRLGLQKIVGISLEKQFGASVIMHGNGVYFAAVIFNWLHKTM